MNWLTWFLLAAHSSCYYYCLPFGRSTHRHTRKKVHIIRNDFACQQLTTRKFAIKYILPTPETCVCCADKRKEKPKTYLWSAYVRKWKRGLFLLQLLEPIIYNSAHCLTTLMYLTFWVKRTHPTLVKHEK